jgi:pimeloyl-ACP methyl ester carboxylesterase
MISRTAPRIAWLACCVLALGLARPDSGLASSILLKDGRTLRGKIAPIGALAEDPRSSKAGQTRTITLVDDDLRRIFVPTFRVAQVLEADTGEVKERIPLKQTVASAGGQVHRVGPIVKITPFDEHGRRTFSMSTAKGQLDVLQGITQITPVWTKVEGLMPAKSTPIIWDMRIATSTLSSDTLRSILARRIDPKNMELRLRVVRLFLQMERYEDAQKELAKVIVDFPGNDRLGREVQALRQLQARRILDEIKVRRKAGQHELVYSLLEKFPTEDVAAETLQEVSELLDDYRQRQKQLAGALAELTKDIATLKDAGTRKQCEALLDEMNQQLNFNSEDRLAAYLQLANDPALAAEQRLALAFSGWLRGGNDADRNLAVALSLAKVRTLVRRFLAEPNAIDRDRILHELQGQEGASPSTVAQIVSHMKPPLDTPEPSVATPGFYKLQIPGIDKEPNVDYYVQLPPAYDPFVRYPTIVTLRGVATTAEQQIDWWAGARSEQGRLGQATRLGYIVIAVDWLKEGQSAYEYSAREHAAVLGSLRDACRRFSIDTDRVFLTGHSIGGNAAWDLGLAHPDLWAGVIPIVAQTERYCSRYWANAKLVPFYVLGGEMDGDKTVKNAADLDRYMTGRYDVTVVEYIGRGHEDFYEDIPNIFDWMSHRQPRNFFPKEFTVGTMRSWDNYFWWFEASKFPERAIVEPANWPPARGARPVEIRGTKLATNGVSITTAASGVTVWLSPELVDFTRHIDIKLNGNPIRFKGEPSIAVLLEDVRTRADRQHPFWAKAEQ